MKTYSIKAKDIQREWHVVDASGQVLGRLATRIAQVLMGKNKPVFTRHLDTGDYVVVVNAAKIRVTGTKEKNKLYYRHSGYPGGLKSVTYGDMAAKHPTRPLEKAVKGMLPHNRLGAAMFKKLKVYAGDSHPHGGQVSGSLPSVNETTVAGDNTVAGSGEAAPA
ncbi:MAG: 50S ribosomal protein L13 [Dehalococcoidia bacterium]|nr:50S ribosomal protein L13 [Dehalococcoidia bacterium]MDZ4245507.1 50S ribosomal protein L13 [Dehalococcoidia bacterium]